MLESRKPHILIRIVTRIQHSLRSKIAMAAPLYYAITDTITRIRFSIIGEIIEDAKFSDVDGDKFCVFLILG